MPQFKATLSDGRVVTLEADSQPSESDVLAVVSNLTPPKSSPAADILSRNENFYQYDEATPGLSEKAINTVAKPVGRGLKFAGDIAAAKLADIGSDITGQTLRDQQEGRLSNLEEVLNKQTPPMVGESKALPVPLRVAESAAQGLVKTVPQLGVVAALEAAGIPAPVSAGAIFGSTEEGFDPKQAAIAAALPFIGKYSGELTGYIAKKFGVDNATAINIVKGAGGMLGASAPLIAQSENQIRQMPVDQRKDARIEMIGNILGQAALGPMGVKFEGKKPTSPEVQAKEPVTPPAAEPAPKVGEQPAPVAAVPEKGVTDASGKSTAVEVAGREQAGPVSEVAKGSASDVQKAAETAKEKEGEIVLTPALKMPSSPPVTGTSHVEAAKSVPLEQRADALEALANDANHIFVDQNGKEYNREQGGVVFDRQQGNPPGTTKNLHSEDLARAKEKSTELAGMGGAGASEIPETGAGGEKYGIAERVRAERAKAGQVDPVEPGQGISAPDSVERGRELLAKGLNPEQAVFEFEKTKSINADAMAVVRAHGEALAKSARDIEGKFGTESSEYEAARKALSDFDRRTKPMQTEWHKIGMAQQGETDIDTGSFTGLERAHREVTDKDFTPEQKQRANRVAKTVKDASDKETDAKSKLSKHLSESDPTSTAAEKAALDAVHKWHQEFASKLADLENKRRVATTVRERETLAIQQKAVKKALDKATKARRDTAIALAKKERTVKERTVLDEQEKAARKALDSANEVVRDAASKRAEAENKARSAKAQRDKEVSQIELKRTKKALDAAMKVRRDAARDLAESERKNRANPEIAVWKKAKEYLDQGIDDFDDVRNKVATDLGMSVDKVTKLLAQDKKAKFLADDAWKKQQDSRRLKEQAKRFLAEIEVPGFEKALKAIPRILFSLKVGLHGTVALGTHAPVVAFDPRFWGSYIKNFGRMYRMVFSPAFYEHQVQDLVRRPNFATARRAGLQNDPFQYEEYHTTAIGNLVRDWLGPHASTFDKLTSSGNRGYSVLKMLRQDMFDQMYNKLPKTQQIPEVASAISDDINHSTGVVKGKAPAGTSTALFAPRLEASRAMWLAGDPIRMTRAFANWNNADIGERAFAINQLKSKAIVFGTFASMLALNQGVLTASGSKQKINGVPKALGGAGFDPLESDFLKFKAAGLDIAYGSAMANMAKLPVRLATAIAFQGKTSKLILEDERVYKIAGDYLRSQMSPFAGTATDLALGRDFAGRPLPRKLFGTLQGDKDIPSRLKLHGVTQPYSWDEYSAQQFTPIPISEAIKEVWGKGGLGMSPEQQQHALKAWAIFSLMAGTGARVTEESPKVNPAFQKAMAGAR